MHDPGELPFRTNLQLFLSRILPLLCPVYNRHPKHIGHWYDTDKMLEPTIQLRLCNLVRRLVQERNNDLMRTERWPGLSLLLFSILPQRVRS